MKNVILVRSFTRIPSSDVCLIRSTSSDPECGGPFEKRKSVMSAELGVLSSLVSPSSARSTSFHSEIEQKNRARLEAALGSYSRVCTQIRDLYWHVYTDGTPPRGAQGPEKRTGPARKSSVASAD
jgi:hypothetical protein